MLGDREGVAVAEEFVNWSGSLRFTPGVHARPRDESAVCRIVEGAADRGQIVRPVGRGHSSVPLARTDDVLLSLEHLVGLVRADPEGLRARLLPGTDLEHVGRDLAAHGLAMENLGDVNYQALAGALATGTHGTGRRFGNISTTLVGGRLVTGTSSVVAFGEDAATPDDDLLRAARVSLGSLGVLTSVTLRVVPAMQLHRMNWCVHIDWVLEHWDGLVDENRHMDVYWYPRSDLAQVRMLNEPGTEPDLQPRHGELRADVMGPGHEVIPNQRELRFDEMEYMLPATAALDCFREARKRIKDRHRQQVGWRVLMRTVAADDSMLSNCYGRPTTTIALLQNNTLPHEEYFADMEPLLQAHGGRPHWGKKHTMAAARLAPLFPEWDAFHRLRRELDPAGVFMNDYLTRLFEESAP